MSQRSRQTASNTQAGHTLPRRPSALRSAALLLIVMAALSPSALADEAQLSLPVTDRAGGGHLLPFMLSLENHSPDDITGIRFNTNQLGSVAVDLLLPAGQSRAYGLGLWYFEGPLRITDLVALAADGRVIHQYPDQSETVQALLPQARLVLIDSGLLAVAEHFSTTAEQLRGLVAADDARRPLVAEVISFADFWWSLAGSQAAALVVPDTSNLPWFRHLAREAMIPLWTVSDRGQLRREIDAPVLLGRVLRSAVLRPDLFDLAVRPSPTRIPEQLFRTPPWPLGDRLRLLLPVLLATILLAVLGLAGRLLAPKWRLTALGTIIALAAIWTIALTKSDAMANVQSLTIAYGDAIDGRRLERSFAMLTSHRLKQVTVRPAQSPQTPGPTLPPRPQLISPDHRIDYRNTAVHLDIEGRWSLNRTPVEPDRLLLFAFDRPVAVSDQPPSVALRFAADGQPQLRLEESLHNVWLMIDGQAWQFGDVAARQTYRPLGPPHRLAAAAYSADLDANALHLRVIQWLGRTWYRPDTVLVFGWQAGGSSNLQVQGALHNDLGRLSVWALPRDKVQRP